MSRYLGSISVAAALLIVGCGGPAARTGSAGSAGSPRALLVARIDSIANARVAEGKVVGMSVAVVKGRDTLLLKGYGKADVELDVPTPPRASYEIGSVTKQFTAVAILQLADAKQLDLDDEITKYFPSFDTHGNKITVRRLLDHTSGIRSYTAIPEFYALGTQHLPPDTLVTLVSKRPFDFPTGDQESYNNSAYFLAGLIVEKVSGQSYGDYVKDHIFARAGMKDSYYCSERAIHKNHAHGHDIDSSGFVLKGYMIHQWSFSAGGLCSTAGDMVAWNQALHGGKVLSPAAYGLLVGPSELNDGTKLRYGKGLKLTDIAGHRAIHHGGSIPGFLAESEYFPDDTLVIVILQNSLSLTGPEETGAKLAEAILGRGPDKRQKYDGDLTQFTGTFKGPGAGRDTEVTVVLVGAGLVLSGLGAAADTLGYLGNDTFGGNETQIAFTRTAGKVTGLDTDTGYFHNRLKRH